MSRYEIREKLGMDSETTLYIVWDTLTGRQLPIQYSNRDMAVRRMERRIERDRRWEMGLE